MSSVDILNDRLSKTLKEFIVPKFQKNFWFISKKPMLKAIGMSLDENSAGDGSNVMPRVQKVEKVNSAYEAEVVHNHTPFGGGTYGQSISQTLRYGKFQGSRSSLRMKTITQAMLIPDQVISASRSNEFSLVNELTQNMTGATHEIHRNLNRMMSGRGSGILGYVNGAVNSSNVVTVQTNTSATNEVDATQYLQRGDVLLIGTTAEIEADPSTAETVTVSSVDSSVQFTTTTDETLSDEDVIVRADVYDATNTVYNEVQSLTGLVTNTGTIQNINKANNFWFQSHVTSSVGTLALSDIDDSVGAVRSFSIDPSALFLMGNRKQWRRYAALLQANRRFQNNTKSDFGGQLAGGIGGLSVYTPDGELPFAIDDDVPDGYIFVIDPNGYAWMDFRPYGPADDALNKEGFPGQRKSGTLDYEFALWMGGNLAQLNAQSSAVLSGITG